MTNAIPSTNSLAPQVRACAILAQIARARSQVYRWLALGFYAPDENLIHALQTGQVVNEIETAMRWLGQDQNRLARSLRMLRDHSMRDLADLPNEFRRLFCKSAERISLRESTYRWREASTLLEFTDDMIRVLRQRYEEFGVAPAPNQEDKLPIEFEFMAFLCECESGNWERQALENARQLRRQEHTFLDDHLARWYPEFCWRVTHQAHESFYAGLAYLADAWLRLEYGPGYVSVK